MVGIKVALVLSILALKTVQALRIIDRREAVTALATQAQMMISSSSVQQPERGKLLHERQSCFQDDESRINLLVPKKSNQGRGQGISSMPSDAGNAMLSVPRVGFSLYKTPQDQVERCVQLALEAGVQHFDVATAYGTNQEAGRVFQRYLVNGLDHGASGASDPSLSSPCLGTSRSQRRARLFVSHKVSNNEQSSKRQNVYKAVKQQISLLKCGYLDMVSIHSPLTDYARRMATYEALWDLQREGAVRAVGVCHYGIPALNELIESTLSISLPPPSVIQLVLSPFSQHKDIAGPLGWAEQHGSLVCCNAWSKLSSIDGPQEGWAILADIAKSKGMTKAQVLVRWALQRGYLCVPRSGSQFKIERAAIAENSYDGVSKFVLTPKEMEILNGLDENLPAGRLGIVDGWVESDIVNAQWDPTSVV